MTKESNYFEKELFALKLTGLSLAGNDSFFYKVYSCLTLILIDFAYPTLQTITSYQNGFDDIEHIFSYNIILCQGLIKACVMLRHRKKLKGVLDKLGTILFDIQSHPQTSYENNIVNACISITSTQLRIYWLSTAISVTGVVLRCLIKHAISDNPNDWELPYGKFELLNTTYSRNFEIMLGYQVLSVAVIGVHLLTVDLITTNVLCHLSHHFKILQIRFSGLVKNINLLTFQEIPYVENKITRRVDRKIDWNLLKVMVKETVKYHLLLIEVAVKMEAVISNLLLLIVVDNSIILCFLAYCMSMAQRNYVQFFEHLGQICIGCLQVFMLCFWGEQISTESQKVAQAITEIDTVGCDLRFQKCLMMVMLRSQKPVTLSMGKFATLGLQTFTSVIRNSYSIFLFLEKCKPT